jgi:hypothetical protein
MVVASPSFSLSLITNKSITTTQSLAFHFTSQQSSGNSSKARRMRGTLKKNRTGVRESLYQKFGKAFWGLVNSMTAEEYARCTPAEQKLYRQAKEDSRDVRGVYLMNTYGIKISRY